MCQYLIGKNLNELFSGGNYVTCLAVNISAFCIKKSLAATGAVWYNAGMTNLELMRLAENTDEDAFEQEDFQHTKKSQKEIYDDFYDDVKQPSRYIKEDW